jgi:hypothetical protein
MSKVLGITHNFIKSSWNHPEFYHRFAALKWQTPCFFHLKKRRLRQAIRAAAGAHAVRVLQDELPEALKRRQVPVASGAQLGGSHHG